MRVQSLGWKDPLKWKWQLTPVFLPGKVHGQKSPEGYSPWSRKELDMTEELYFLSLEEMRQEESNGKKDVGVSHIEGFGPCLLDKPEREGTMSDVSEGVSAGADVVS